MSAPGGGAERRARGPAAPSRDVRRSRPRAAWISASLFVAAIAASPVAAISCDGAVAPYCEKLCACAACSGAQRDECTDNLGDSRHRADLESCADVFDKYSDCATDHLACTEGTPALTDCKAEADALYDCAGDIGFGKTACEAAVELYASKYASCGVDLPEGTGSVGVCNVLQKNRATCRMACVKNASCDALTGKDGPGSVDLNNCLDGCG